MMTRRRKDSACTARGQHSAASVQTFLPIKSHEENNTLNELVGGAYDWRDCRSFDTAGLPAFRWLSPYTARTAGFLNFYVHVILFQPVESSRIVEPD